MYHQMQRRWKHILVGVLLLSVHVRSASLGIDFGNEYNKGALIAPGKLFVMVENKISKRKSPSYLTFLNNNRLYENPAENKCIKTSRNSFYFMNKFFGTCSADEELLATLKKELLQDYEIRCDEIGTLFRLKRFKFDLSKTVGMKYRKEFGLEPKVKKEKPTQEKEKKEGETEADEGQSEEPKEPEEVPEEAEEESPEPTDEEVLSQIHQQIFRKTDESNEHEYRLEELYAMQLENMRENAESTGNARFTSAVLTIWDNDLTVRARKQLADSMWLAGMKPLAFVHENTAAALKQSIDIRPDKDYQPEQVVYVNLGSGGGKISLIEFDKVEAKSFKKEKDYNVSFKVLEDAFDERVGANHLNKCLLQLVVRKFFEKQGKNWREQTVRDKKMRGLMLALKKKKHVLSVNSEVSVWVEEFWEERDLNVQVTADELKEECAYLLDNLEAFFRDFKKKVADNEMDFANVKRVELIGGGVRNPFVREVIADSWMQEDLEVFNHLNGDEAMALGASFVAANYSSSFRARPILINDGPGYNVEVKVNFPGEEDPEKATKEGMLFPRKKARYGHKKTMTLPDVKKDFTVKLLADDQDNFNVDYSVSGFESGLKSMEGKNITEWKTNLYFELDLLGIPKLKKADIKLKENYWEEVKVKIEKKEEQKEEEKKEEKGEEQGKAEEKEQKEAKEEDKKEEDKSSEEGEKKAGAEDKKEGEKQEEEEKKPEEPEYEVKNELRTRNLVVSLRVKQTGISVKTLKDYPEEWKKSRRLLKVYKEEENQRKKILSMKNELESAMYELKEIVNDEDNKARFLSDEEKEEWIQFASELEEFIFFTKPSQSELEDRRWKMKKLRKNFDFRFGEWRDRDVLIETVLKVFNDMQNQISKIQKNNADIPDSEIGETQMKVEGAREWLVGVKGKLAEQKLFEAPQTTKREILKKKDEMKELVFKLRNYKKPKEKKKKADDKVADLRAKMAKEMNLDPKLFEGMDDEQLTQLLETMMKAAEAKKGEEAKEGEAESKGAEEPQQEPTKEENTENAEPVETKAEETVSENLNNVDGEQKEDDVTKDL